MAAPLFFCIQALFGLHTKVRIKQAGAATVETVEKRDTANPHFALAIMDTMHGTDTREEFDILKVRMKQGGGMRVFVKLYQLGA